MHAAGYRKSIAQAFWPAWFNSQKTVSARYRGIPPAPWLIAACVAQIHEGFAEKSKAV
jgi:hypothetical protein